MQIMRITGPTKISCFRYCCLLLSTIFMISSALPASAEAPVKVLFLSPDPAPEPNEISFWHNTISFMQSAADDLDIELQIIYSKGNTFSYKRDGLKIINEMDTSTYLLSGYVPGATKIHLKAASQRGINYFIFNMATPDSDKTEVDKPRGKYSNWIGHMWPDDVAAGYVMAEVLVNEASKNQPEDNTDNQIIGLSAHYDEYTAYYRNEGLNNFVNSHNDTILNGLSFTQWNEDLAEKITRDFLAKFPRTNIIWAAGDVLALRALQVVEELNRKPGKDIFVGGSNWTVAGLEAVAKGKLVTSLGGHFMEGGWALILIHDYHHGIDFADDVSTEIPTKLKPANTNNVNQILDAIVNERWKKIDFRQFSKHYDKSLKKYDFSHRVIINGSTH